jgi:hypothetical protein
LVVVVKKKTLAWLLVLELEEVIVSSLDVTSSFAVVVAAVVVAASSVLASSVVAFVALTLTVVEVLMEVPWVPVSALA